MFLTQRRFDIQRHLHKTKTYSLTYSSVLEHDNEIREAGRRQIL